MHERLKSELSPVEAVRAEIPSPEMPAANSGRILHILIAGAAAKSIRSNIRCATVGTSRDGAAGDRNCRVTNRPLPGKPSVARWPRGGPRRAACPRPRQGKALRGPGESYSEVVLRLAKG